MDPTQDKYTVHGNANKQQGVALGRGRNPDVVARLSPESPLFQAIAVHKQEAQLTS